MKKALKIIIATVVICALWFGVSTLINSLIHRNDEDPKVEEFIENNTVEEVEVKENQSTTEIPEGYIEDEFLMEEQEVESEAFELQGEIAYNGTSELPKVEVGEWNGLTYYSQIDPRWKNKLYTSTGNSSQTIGSSACGPTCAAMVVSSIKGTILPPEMCELFVDYGYRSANNGTYWSAFRFTADVFDIEYLEYYKLADVYDKLDENWMAVAACGNGLFTSGGHFILICGWVDEDGDGVCEETDALKIYDPYLYSGKFNISTRRGKVTVDGYTVYCSIKNFRAYANYSGFFLFKNEHTEEYKPETKPVEPTVATHERFVKVNSSLNVRIGPGTNYKYVRSLYNGDKVTVYEESGNWSRIGNNEWVCSTYLSDSNVQITNTVGQTRKLRTTTTLYSRSDLSGTTYTYLPNTSVVIKKNVSSTVDYIYVPATGRWAYVSTSAYTTSTQTTGTSLKGTYQKFRGDTIIWSNSDLTGTKYYYLPNTKVKVLDDLGNVNYIYVPATGRYGYVYESVYK